MMIGIMMHEQQELALTRVALKMLALNDLFYNVFCVGLEVINRVRTHVFVFVCDVLEMINRIFVSVVDILFCFAVSICAQHIQPCNYRF